MEIIVIYTYPCNSSRLEQGSGKEKGYVVDLSLGLKDWDQSNFAERVRSNIEPV